MSDELKEAKLKHFENENAQLQMAIKNVSSQVRARQIQAQEQFEQNAQFRTSILLLEDALRLAQIDNGSLNERVKVLELEKADLQKRLDVALSAEPKAA
jgi:hypothetical protein